MTAKKIMVVEDESVISLDIRNSLIKMGYSVSGVAATGESALAKMATNRPDLVLMDIHLKGEMSGIDVSKKIKTDFQIPIVYLTANADSSTFQEAKGTDPYGYLLKPFEERELGIAIEIALNKHSKEQTVRSSESWYASAFQSFSEAVFATDLTGRVVFMNRLAEALTGWKLQDALDKPLGSVLTLHRQIQQFDQMSKQESITAIVKAALSEKEAIAIPSSSQILTKKKRITAVEGSATSIRDSANSVIGSLFIIRERGQENDQTKGPKSNKRTPESISAQKTRTRRSACSAAGVDSEDTSLIASFVQAFINGESVALSTMRLIASCGDGTATLSDRKEGVIVSVKQIQGVKTGIVNQKSRYCELVRHLLIENSYFPISRRTNGTCYYQFRTLPERCQVYHTSATELGSAWHGELEDKASKDIDRGYTPAQTKLRRENIIVLRRGTWYHIQSIIAVAEGLRIRTVGGDIFVSPQDLLVWGVQRWL